MFVGPEALTPSANGLFTGGGEPEDRNSEASVIESSQEVQ